jgi:hypothetical protein
MQQYANAPSVPLTTSFLSVFLDGPSVTGTEYNVPTPVTVGLPVSDKRLTHIAGTHFGTNYIGAVRHYT